MKASILSAFSLGFSRWIISSHSLRLAKILSVKLHLSTYSSAQTYVLGAHKNRLIETVLLSTHNIRFG